MITNSAASLFFAIDGFCAIYHNAYLGALSYVVKYTCDDMWFHLSCTIQFTKNLIQSAK